MSPVARIIIGIVVVGLGAIMVYKTPWVMSMVGRIYFAEKNFGPGGTRIFYKLLGVLVIIVGFIIMTNLFDRLVGGFITNIFS